VKLLTRKARQPLTVMPSDAYRPAVVQHVRLGYRMAQNETSRPSNRIDSLIGIGTTIEGNVFASGALRIDGRVKGNVAPSGVESFTLVLSEHGSIEGAVQATHAIINGRVVGQVSATDSIELQPKCKIEGDVQYDRLEMHSGAIVNGGLQRSTSKRGEEGQTGPRLAAVS
jgi:cytoskeletal protein CcmA (bactofilin family)